MSTKERKHPAPPRYDEALLHLLELAGAEGEVARGDLVAEGLAHLTDAEGQLAAFPERSEDIW